MFIRTITFFQKPLVLQLSTLIFNYLRSGQATMAQVLADAVVPHAHAAVQGAAEAGRAVEDIREGPCPNLGVTP